MRARRTARRATLVLLSAWLGGACRPEPPVAPEDAAPSPDEAASPGEASGEEETPALTDPATPRPRPPAEPVASRDEAIAAIGTGNPEGALRFFEAQTAETFAADPELHAWRARAAWATGAFALAQAEFDAALAASQPSPSDEQRVAWTLELIDLLEARGDREGVRAQLDAARKRDPKRLEFRGRQLSFWVSTGRGDSPEATALMEGLYDAFDAGEAKTPAQLLAVARAALARASTGGFKDASWVLEEAEGLAPASSGDPLADRLLLLHADVFLEKYAPEEAQSTLGMILARDDWHPEALAALSRVEFERYHLAAARRLAREALLVNPHQLDAHAVLAKVDLIEGRRVEAGKRIREEILPYNPNHVEGLVAAAALAIFEDRNDELDAAEKAARSWHPNNPRYFTSLGDLLGSLHLYRDADTVLTRGRKLAPEDPYVQSAFGLNRLRLGDESEGRPAIEAAYAKDRFNERTLNTRRLYKERIEPHYTEYAQGDLWIRVPKESSEEILPELYAELAKARHTLDRAYGVDPGTTRFEIFDRPEDFAIRTVGTSALGAVGVCFGPTITAIGPYTASHNFYMVAWHELAHVYAIELSRGRVPRWFTEGLSEWEASEADPSWTRRSTVLLKAARAEGRLRALSELELAFLRAGSAAMMEVAYMTAAYAMRYLGETYGRAKLIDILRGYGEGKETDELFKAHLGKDMATVEREFAAWFDDQLDTQVSGWSPSQRRKSDALNERFAEAVEAIQRQELDEATRILQAMIQEGGDGYPTRMLLAQALMEGPATASAEAHLRKAAEYNLEDPEPHRLLARLAREKGDVKSEMSALEQVLKLDPVAFETNLIFLATALAVDDAPGIARATRRCEAIAPLHPACLAATAARVRAKEGKRAAQLLERAESLRARISAGEATGAVMALAAARAGDRTRAAKWAEQGGAIAAQSKVIREALAKL